MPGCVIKAILLSMVVASISFFLSHTQLLEKQRKWLWDHIEFFAKLLECCYCLGHWIALILLILFPVRLFDYVPIFYGHGKPVIDFILTWLVISWMAGLQSMAASRLWGE